MCSGGSKHSCTSGLVSLSTEQLMNDIAVLKIIHGTTSCIPTQTN